MLFNEVLGHAHLKKHLTQSADSGRIPHAQLFVGPQGSGVLPLAIAYAQYVLCGNSSGENDNGNSSCNLKCDHLTHPDLHFVFPVTTTDKIKTHPLSSNFLEQWRSFVKEQPYGNLFDWYKVLEVDNKQGNIGVEQAQEIVKTLSLKSYEGGYKVMIIWMAERMNSAASNKLLKLIEEPAPKTLLILITEDEAQIMQTILSRCQVLNFPPLAELEIVQALIGRGINENEALKIANSANGDYNKALDLINQDSDDLIFEKWFVNWVRTAFRAKGNKAVISELLAWGEELSKAGRETQKKFLLFCLDVFRQALLINYKAEKLTYMEFTSENFKLEKFAPFVHGGNIVEITNELEQAIYHVERNGNGKIIFTDLSIKLTRFLHMKE